MSGPEILFSCAGNARLTAPGCRALVAAARALPADKDGVAA
jgi:hypothetical protein